MALLQVSNLSKSFGEEHAVRDVDLAVSPGEIFGLIGPDGAGKTTTLRMIAGLMDPDVGSVLVDDIPVAQKPEQVRERLGYMPQQYSMYADLTVAENMNFFADMYFVPKKERRKRIERLYEFSRLGPFAKRPAGKLSGGMYKKLALSCNMIHTPKLLLLDEPTNGVDPLSRRELWEILYGFATDGVGIVVSTPYMDEAERCHRLALMHQGKLLHVDTPAKILAGFNEDIYELMTGDIQGARALLDKSTAAHRAYPAGDALKIVVDRGGDPNLFSNELTSNGIDIESLVQVQPNFEDVFLAEVERNQ